MLERPSNRPTWLGTAIFVLSLLTERSLSYPSGAPPSTCSSMTPSHPGSSQPAATSPYMVYVSGGQYAPGSQLTVTINGTQSFKGFLLLAKTSSNNAIGSFAPAPQSQQVCGAGLTHTSSTPVSSLSVVWTAPASSQGSVRFYATVVQSLSVYWVALSSSVVSESLPSTTSTAVTSATIRTTSLTSAPSTAVPLIKDLSGCGVNASCFSMPTGCTGISCSYLLVWRPISGSPNLVQFRLQGRTTATPGYVSVGFGQSRSMNGLSIINCVATNTGATVKQAYSTRNAEPAFLNVASNLQNVTAISSRELIQCSFVWDNDARTSDQQPDLTALQYLVMARGPAVGNAAGNILKHTENPVSLVDRIVIASTQYADYPILASSKKSPSIELRFNVTIKSGSSSISGYYSVKWLLGLLLCVLTFTV